MNLSRTCTGESGCYERGCYGRNFVSAHVLADEDHSGLLPHPSVGPHFAGVDSAIATSKDHTCIQTHMHMALFYGRSCVRNRTLCDSNVRTSKRWPQSRLAPLWNGTSSVTTKLVTACAARNFNGSCARSRSRPEIEFVRARARTRRGFAS